MKLLTKWQTWRVEGREENKFHNDMLLAPEEFIMIQGPNGLQQVIGSPILYTKVHLAASWEHRDTEFVETEK